MSHARDLRIAYVSPLNPQSTGVSDYSEELLPALGQLAEVDLFVDGFVPANPAIRDHFARFDCADFPTHAAERRHDVNLYQMGNSLYHAPIFRLLTRFPGIVVLHDVVLHHFFLELARRDRDPSLYLREMAYARGIDGIADGLAVLTGEQPPALFDDPLIDRIRDASLGILVHSEFARSLVAARGADRVGVVPAHVATPSPLSSVQRRATRAELGLPADAIIAGAFGLATPAKCLDVALRAFARVHREIPTTRFLIAGPVEPPGWLDPIIAELGLASAVTLSGPLPFDRFLRAIASVDIGINLRDPTAGETSASLLRLMAAGVPSIVSDVGAFAELPDGTCWKIANGANAEDALAQALYALATAESRRVELATAGRAHVLAHHSPSSTARAYRAFIEHLLGRAQS